ncbi:MAG: protein-glutamine glutaminase family protein [Bacteriovoracia bacterium]
MKKALLIAFMTTMTTLAWGERFTDHIHSVSEGKNGAEHLVMLSSGRVVFIDQGISPDFDLSEFQAGERVELEVDDKLTLMSITSLPPTETPQENMSFQGPEFLQDPTVLPDYSSAKRIFNGMNRSYKKKTECSDRAHVWSYEEWKKHGLISNKVFLFFTNTYIRKYRFYWWFHVSPYTLIRENGKVVENVLDRRYTGYPYHMKNWTDVFIRSKKSCPVKTYAHYRANKNGPEHCFLVKTSMYYRLPYHVRMMEDNGVIKTRFSTSEVNFSYRAFTRRGARKLD